MYLYRQTDFNRCSVFHVGAQWCCIAVSHPIHHPYGAGQEMEVLIPVSKASLSKLNTPECDAVPAHQSHREPSVAGFVQSE